MKNKFIFCLTFFLFLLFIFTINCFASFDIVDNGVTVSLPDLPFDTTEHPVFFIGRSFYNNKNLYTVAYPSSDVENFYVSDYNTTAITYYKKGTTTKGQFAYYDITATNLTEWGVEKYTYYSELKLASTGYLVYSTNNIYRDNSFTDIYFESSLSSVPELIFPSIHNSESELSNLNMEYLKILPGDFNSDNLTFILYNYNDGSIVSKILLSEYEEYFQRIDLENPFSDLGYIIPVNVLPKISVTEGIEYNWAILYEDTSQIDYIVTSSVTATIGSETEKSPEDIRNEELKDSISDNTDKIIESNKETQEKLEEQTDAIKENTETNKNIFQKIGDILSYINPLSDNFFGRKLVELIIDGLKSLFIPEDNFFSEYFDELNNWFSDRLGFLYYPLELLFDLLDRFTNINFEEPVINIPDIKEPTTNITFISATSFNFNSLLENNTFASVHDIYLLILDAGIYIGLVMLLMKKYEEVMTK